MVIRIERTRVHRDSLHAFRIRAMAKVADARKVGGAIDAHLGSQADGTGYQQFVCITRWQTMDALYAWTGGRDLLARPIYFDGLEDALLDFDVQHYIDSESTN